MTPSTAAPLNLARLKLAEYNLDQCGRPTLPDGARYVDLYRVLFYNNVIGATTELPDERQSTGGNTVFFLRAISQQNVNANLTYVKFQWPNGNYLSNVEELINATLFYGRFRRAFRNPVVIRPGEQIRFSLHNTRAVAAQVSFTFEGYFRYYLTPNQAQACCIDRL